MATSVTPSSRILLLSYATGDVNSNPAVPSLVASTFAVVASRQPSTMLGTTASPSNAADTTSQISA